MSESAVTSPENNDVFADIRPYNDDELPAVLDRVVNDDEFISAIFQLQFSQAPSVLHWPLKQAVKFWLRFKANGIKSVRDFQWLVRPYVDKTIQRSTAGFTFSGLENLDPEKSYLFISNHRDIALDPALLNFALVTTGMETVRIAIGNNLLTKPFASDLMRLNKSFIVDRSAKGPRQILQASKKLAQYIRHSINGDRNSVWLAQREGRAKDGRDQTEPAIIKMLSLAKHSKAEPLADLIQNLHIVPVAISYEYDPCDAMKANELYQKETTGGYEKAEQEDISSIARGIEGEKGHVHIAVGAELGGDYQTPEEVAIAIDNQILSLYKLHSSNYYAYRALYGESPEVEAIAESHGWSSAASNMQKVVFESRVQALPKDQAPYLLQMYAECLKRKLDMGLVQ